MALYQQHIARQFEQQAQMQGGGTVVAFEVSGEGGHGGSGWDFEVSPGAF